MSKKRDAKSSKRASRTDTVRSAVDQAFQATAQATADAGLLTRGRAAEIADELVGNITRLRDALEDARPASTEDLKALRVDMAALAERLDRLEGARAAGAVTGSDPAAAAKPAARSASPRRGAAKPSAAKPSARASASRSAAAKRTSAAAAAAKPTSAKPRTASKPKQAAKPAAARPAAAKPAASKARASSPARAGASGTRSSRKSSASATKT